MLVVNSNNTIDDVKYELYSEDGTHMVKVVNICNLMDRLYPEEWHEPSSTTRPGWMDVDYKESSTAVMSWCDENNSHYYAAPREDFFIFKAVGEAIVEGKDIVVVEDLS